MHSVVRRVEQEMSSAERTAPSGTGTAWMQIDEARLTGRQKSLVFLGILGNVSEFFDAFLIGFVVSAVRRVSE